MRFGARAVRRCRLCTAVWGGRTARFCGRCGHPLFDEAGGTGGGQPRVTGRAAVPRRAGLAVLGVLLLSGSVAAAAWTTPGESVVAAHPEVTLPAQDELGDGPPRPETTSDPEVTDGPDCRPDGCARWRAPLGSGNVRVTDDGTVYHLTPTELTRMDAQDGRVEWRRSLLDRRNAQGFQPPSIFPIDHELVLLAFGRSGEVEFRWTGDGKLLWQTDLGASHISSATRIGGVVVVAGRVAGRAVADPAPSMFVTAIDRETREVIWRREVDEVVTAASNPTIVRRDDGQLAALDPATGATRWSLSLDAGITVLEGGEQLALVGSRAIDVIDRRSGDRSHRIDRPAGTDGRVQTEGALLLMRSTSGSDPSTRARSDLSVADLSEPDGPVTAYPGAGRIVALEDGVVIVRQSGASLRLHRLDAAGQQLWERVVDLTDPVCCWRIEQAAAADRFVVVPPRLDREAIRLLSTADGSTRSSFRLSAALRESPDLRWLGPVAMRFDGEQTTLAGPGGEVRLPGRAAVVSTQDPLLLATPDGLVAVDEHRVTVTD